MCVLKQQTLAQDLRAGLHHIKENVGAWRPSSFLLKISNPSESLSLVGLYNSQELLSSGRPNNSNEEDLRGLIL